MSYIHYLFSEYSSIDEYLNSILIIQKDKNNKDKYTCNFCNIICTRLHDLKRHTESHLNIKYICDTCKKRYNRKYYINRHLCNNSKK